MLRSALSMAILGRIARRSRLPAGHFKALLPHPGRGGRPSAPEGCQRLEARRLAWHLPDDFGNRSPAHRNEILEWVRTNIIAGTTLTRP
jgi:hypothetical protein